MATPATIQVKRSARLISPKGRASHPHLFKPSAFQDKGEAKYSTILMLEKSVAANKDFIAKVRTAQDAALADLYGKKLPENLERWGVTDGDTAVDSEGNAIPGAAGHWLIKAGNKAKPAIIDAQGTEILDELSVYGGCYGRVNVCAKAYGTPAKGGVTLELNVFQKISDGPAFGGAEKAKQAALAEMGAYDDEEF